MSPEGIWGTQSPDRLDPADRVRSRTYLYLRFGMIGAVLLVFVSIAKEYTEAHCFQNSISAYYYTPVRAIFVGTLFAVSFALIVYRAEGQWEDFFLNLAGIFVPIVAVAPTTDVGDCWSIEPMPAPLNPDGSLQTWVVANIDNNMFALLVIGAVGLAVAAAMAWREDGGALYQDAQTGLSRRSNPWTVMALAALLLFGIAVVSVVWDDFDTRGHGYAAVLFFVSLMLAVGAQALHVRRWYEGRWWQWYAAVGVAMVATGAVFLVFNFGRQEIAVLESLEILLFAAYWITQTFEKRQPKPPLKIESPVASSAA